MWTKEGCLALLRETLALFGQAQHPENQTLALLGLLQAATHSKRPQHTATCSRQRLALSSDVLSIKRKTFHLKGVIPPRSGSAKVSWVERPSFLHVQRLIISLSCLYPWWGPNNHLMGSSAPWRSELIISPCVPVHWYLSVGHGPAHQKLRPPWAH